MGNVRNTRRLKPSTPTEYTGKNWNYIFNSSSQHTTIFGAGVGINGDLYTYISDSQYSSVDFMLCLTPNGETRWKMYLQSVPLKMVVGVSNIISNREDNTLIYISTWADTGSYVSQICRVYYPDTKHPAQECITTYDISIPISSPISLDTKSNLLITSAFDDKPAAFNLTTFEMLWVDKETMGADMGSDYKIDLSTGDLYWIGGDDNFRRMNSTGFCLIESGDVNSGGSRDFAFDNQHQIIVRAWQNMTDRRWPIVLSAWDVDNMNISVRWEWKSIDVNSTSTDCTPPIIDNQYGLTYFANLPYSIAFNTQTGDIQWQTAIVTTEEIDQLNLISTCITFNENTRIVYVLTHSEFTYSTIFLTALHADTGKILRRIDILKDGKNVTEQNKITIPYCPILIGNDMIYISWLLGSYPDLVPLNIIGVPQLS